MKAYRLEKPGGIDCLDLVDIPIPSPTTGEVLVRINAVSLNYRDLITVNGGYGSWQKRPLIPTSDSAGVVEAIGPGVKRFKIGDRVINGFLPNWLCGAPTEENLYKTWGGTSDGVLAEYCVFPESTLLHSPKLLSDSEAATLACAAVTAWSAVVKLGGIKPGSIILTQGSGGVSLFALQFAKLAGAQVIAISSNNLKLDRLRQMNADATINYMTTPRWGSQARLLSGGRGVDLVIEIGGAGTLNESIRATRVNGTIALIGALAISNEDLRLPLIAMQQQRIQGIACGSMEDLQAVIDAIDLHGIKPVIDREFPFEQTRVAFAHLASGQHFGKIVITMN